MTQRQEAKKAKELKRRYGRLAESMEPYYHHLDLRPLTELDDDGLEYILAKVKGVYMFDLNETEITNKSIALLTQLEYIQELRLKSCRGIDDDCMEDMNRITALEFLHLRYTGVTIDGALKLSALTKLKTLMISAEEQDDIKEKIEQFKQVLPQCELVIDGKNV